MNLPPVNHPRCRRNWSLIAAFFLEPRCHRTNLKKKHGSETTTAVLPSLYILTNTLYAFRILVNLPPSLSSIKHHRSPFAVRNFLWVILGHQTEKTFRCKKVWVPRLGELTAWNRHFFSLKTNMTITVLKIHNLNEDGSISYWISGEFSSNRHVSFRGYSKCLDQISN